jgi:hypothetical protein
MNAEMMTENKFTPPVSKVVTIRATTATFSSSVELFDSDTYFEDFVFIFNFSFLVFVRQQGITAAL